jgi:hypothetical protein
MKKSENRKGPEQDMPLERHALSDVILPPGPYILGFHHFPIIYSNFESINRLKH